MPSASPIVAKLGSEKIHVRKVVLGEMEHQEAGEAVDAVECGPERQYGGGSGGWGGGGGWWL